MDIANVDPAETPSGPVIVDPNARVQTAIDGHGVILANPLIQTEIELSRLCEPFDVCLDGYGHHLVFNQHTVHSERIKLFRRWLHDEAA